MSEEGIDRNTKDTDSFEIPVCETGAMEILQTLGCPVQLFPHFSEETSGKSDATYQLQPVYVIISYVVHDVAMGHPL